MTRSDAPKTSEANLSIVVVADAAKRLRCQTVLARQRIASRGASLAGARRVLRPYRPRVLLLDAARSPRRALGALPTLKRLSPDTGIAAIPISTVTRASLVYARVVS